MEESCDSEEKEGTATSGRSAGSRDAARWAEREEQQRGRWRDHPYDEDEYDELQSRGGDQDEYRGQGWYGRHEGYAGSPYGRSRRFEG
jgi:hypothetical protein